MSARKGEAAFDWWTLVHAAAGAAVGLTGLDWFWGLGLIIGFELLEGGLRRIKVEEGGLFEYESWPNIVVDILVGAAAYLLVRYALPFEGPLAGWP